MDHRAALVFTAILAGCTSNGQRIDRVAESAGLSRTIYRGAAFPALIYMRSLPVGPAAADAPLIVFLEGDGQPWPDGREPALDPTTERPIALDLLLQTHQPAAYVTRPCYHDLQTKACTVDVWTNGRYSEEVVTSMTASVREALRLASKRKVILVGYSGGGVLAVLIGERLENVAAVVTIAASLDTDAWTQHHQYLSLSQSLNPARSQLPHHWPEIHLHGANDDNVPTQTTAAYFERYPSARQRVIDGYDHVCCWVDNWSQLMQWPR